MIFVLRTRPLLLGISALGHCDTESEGQVTRALTLFVQSPDHPIVTFSLIFHLVVTCHSFFCKITRNKIKMINRCDQNRHDFNI